MNEEIVVVKTNDGYRVGDHEVKSIDAVFCILLDKFEKRNKRGEDCDTFGQVVIVRCPPPVPGPTASIKKPKEPKEET